MLPEKIMQSDLLDILFENRNKNYGAYALRKSYNKILIASIGCTLLVALLFSILQSFHHLKRNEVVTIFFAPDQEPIKLLNDKNIALPLSLIPYHDYFPLSSFKYKLSDGKTPLSFDTEFEFKPYLEMLHNKWSFIPKLDLTLGLSSEYSSKGGFDMTGGSIKLKFASGIINLQGYINEPLPPTPMLVSGNGQSPMWIMRTLPGQFDDQLPKGTGVFLSVDVLRLPDLFTNGGEKKP